MTEACKEVLFTDISPTVINNDMILKALDAARPLGEAGRLSREEGVVLEEVKELRLDYLSTYFFLINFKKTLAIFL